MTPIYNAFLQKSLLDRSFGLFFWVEVVLFVINAAAYWKLFTKMGEKGWKGFIPLYNLYLMCKNCWEEKYFFIWLILTAVNQYYGYTEKSGFLISVWLFISAIVLFVLTIKYSIKVSKAFGHGILFGLGMCIFETLFIWILGLGGSRYIGKKHNGDVI